MASLASVAAAAWVNGLDPRLRLVAAVVFTRAVVAVGRPLSGALAALLALALAIAAGLSLALLRRGLPLAWLMVALLVTLPFTVPGPALFTIGHGRPAPRGAAGRRLECRR